MARDQIIEEPTIVHPLLRIVDENQKLTIDQRSVIAGFGVDVLVNHGTEDKALFEDAITLVVDFLLRVSANPKLIEPQSRVHAARGRRARRHGRRSRRRRRVSRQHEEDARGAERLRRAGRGGGRRRLAATSRLFMRCVLGLGAGRGSCCVRQWSVPRPQTRSTAWMPTTSRSGTARPGCPARARSFGSLNVGTSTAVVGDVEVRVAGRQPLAVEDTAARGIGSARRAAARRRRSVMRSSRAQVLAQRLVVLVVGVGLLRPATTVRSVDEAREVVDVAVRVVAGDAVARARAPCATPRYSREHALELLARRGPGLRAWTSLEQALLGRQQRAPPLTSMAPPSSTTRATRLPSTRGRLPLPQARAAAAMPSLTRVVAACGSGTSPSR